MLGNSTVPATSAMAVIARRGLRVRGRVPASVPCHGRGGARRSEPRAEGGGPGPQRALAAWYLLLVGACLVPAPWKHGLRGSGPPLRARFPFGCQPIQEISYLARL